MSKIFAVLLLGLGALGFIALAHSADDPADARIALARWGARQSIRVAVRDRLSRAHRHRRRHLARL